uniref:Uncharacterized protein n=1 Tax=Salix viminalis TaxID=40686 RepID=A0A6N2K533_SALVM
MQGTKSKSPSTKLGNLEQIKLPACHYIFGLFTSSFLYMQFLKQMQHFQTRLQLQVLLSLSSSRMNHLLQ